MINMIALLTEARECAVSGAGMALILSSRFSIWPSVNRICRISETSAASSPSLTIPAETLFLAASRIDRA